MLRRHTTGVRSTTLGPSTTRASGLVACSLAVMLLGCSSTPSPVPPSTLPPETSADAPWSAPRLSVASVPQPYFTAWGRAENRNSCDLIAFAESAATQGAAPRAATFSGGWGIAYDQPDLRSAFGVAGTGVEASGTTYDEWSHRITWPDGSSVGYGPEGGTGPNQLAYLTIAGQQCLYNVWTRVSQAHLEQLIGTLRFVETGGLKDDRGDGESR